MSPPGRLEPRAESDRLSTGSGGILCQDPNGNETGDVPDWDRQAVNAENGNELGTKSSGTAVAVR